MVLNQAPVPEQVKQEAEARRTLAYEQAISQPRVAKDAETEGEEQVENEKIPDFETVTSEATPENAGDPPAVQDVPSDEEVPQDMAALPPDEDVPPLPGEPGSEQWGTDDAEQWGDERAPVDPYANQNDPYGSPSSDPYGQAERYDPYAQPGGQQAYGGPSADDPSVPRRYGDPNGDPYAAQRDPYANQADPYGPPPGDPYGQGDPYAAQRDPYGSPQGQTPYGSPQGQAPYGIDQNGEEWAQVIVSGSGMRASASEEAPILFAFPYGRNLKVVSRYEGWVEVTDPKSSATGWMQAHALGPGVPPGQPAYGQGQAYYDEEPQERPGIFKRGGIADMINRAFGGGGN